MIYLLSFVVFKLWVFYAKLVLHCFFSSVSQQLKVTKAPAPHPCALTSSSSSSHDHSIPILNAIKWSLDCSQPLFNPIEVRRGRGWGLRAKGARRINRLFFSVPNPYPVKSSVLRWRPILSRLYLRAQRSNKNTRK